MGKLDIIAEPGKHDIILTRVFDAPRDLVFKVSMDPESIPHWWGPRFLTTTVDAMDVRKGGIWRFVQQGSDGRDHAFNGVYHEVVPSERVTNTFEYEAMPGHVVLETTTFEDHDGGTKLTTRSVFQTVEDRDGMLASGMEKGVLDSRDRLTELLAKAQAAR